MPYIYGREGRLFVCLFVCLFEGRRRRAWKTTKQSKTKCLMTMESMGEEISSSLSVYIFAISKRTLCCTFMQIMLIAMEYL